MTDAVYHVVVYAPPPEGWDPDVPYTEIAQEGDFTVEKDLTTSSFVVTDPNGGKHLVEDPVTDLGPIVSGWMKT